MEVERDDEHFSIVSLSCPLLYEWERCLGLEQNFHLNNALLFDI